MTESFTMRTVHRAALAAFCAVLALAAVPAAAQSGDRLVPVYAGRIDMQRELTAMLEDRLRIVARPHELHVAVQLAMRGEIRQTEKGGEPGAEMKIGSQQQMSLPGLPAIDRSLTGVGAPNISVKIPGRKGDVQRSLESEIARIQVRMYVDAAMPKDVRDRVGALAAGLAGLDAARGDVLEIVDLTPAPSMAVSETAIPPWALLVAGSGVLAALILAGGLAVGGRRGRGRNDLSVQLDDEKASGAVDSIAIAGGAGAASTVSNVNVKVSNAERSVRGFHFLEGATDDELVELLGALEAETAAVVVDCAGIGEGVAARFFGTLDAPKRLALSVALGRARVLPRTALAEIEARVQRELEAVRSRVKLGGEKALLEMLAHMSASAQQDLLAALAETDAALAQALRGKLLFFEDLASLPLGAIRSIVAAVNPATAATALRDAPAPVRDAVLGAVSKRLRGILEAEGEAVGDKTQSEVEAARKSVESVMRRLQAAGTLQTTPSA